VIDIDGNNPEAKKIIEAVKEAEKEVSLHNEGLLKKKLITYQ
jgi:hypothetical protein